MVTRSIGKARRLCKGKKGYKLKKCMRTVMKGSTRRRKKRR